MHKIISFCFVVFLLTFFSDFAYGEYVRRVIDGDTFVLENNQKVRMIGIDAPEISNVKYNKIGEPYGEESKRALKRMILGKNVRLEKDLEEFDRYGRRLSYVFLEDQTFANKKMIEIGLAETFRKFPFKYKEEFLLIEKEAKAKKIGMWKDHTKSAGNKTISFFKNIFNNNIKEEV